MEHDVIRPQFTTKVLRTRYGTSRHVADWRGEPVCRQRMKALTESPKDPPADLCGNCQTIGDTLAARVIHGEDLWLIPWDGTGLDIRAHDIRWEDVLGDTQVTDPDVVRWAELYRIFRETNEHQGLAAARAAEREWGHQAAWVEGLVRRTAEPLVGTVVVEEDTGQVRLDRLVGVMWTQDLEDYRDHCGGWCFAVFDATVVKVDSDVYRMKPSGNGSWIGTPVADGETTTTWGCFRFVDGSDASVMDPPFTELQPVEAD